MSNFVVNFVTHAWIDDFVDALDAGIAEKLGGGAHALAHVANRIAIASH